MHCFSNSTRDPDISILLKSQRAKKVVSGLVGFAIGLLFFVLKVPNLQVWGNSNHRRIVINPANQKGFWG